MVAAKAELIRAMLAGIETLPLASEAELTADVRMVAAGESFLWRSLETLFDLGRHVLAKGFGKVVPEYAVVAAELGAEGILSPESTMKLRQMAGYRNRLVHAYEAVTPGELYGILTKDRGDVAAILTMIQQWIAAHPEICDEAL
jgi:uncharacterized protein YutE (UPF0331/DUF86 family)